MSKAIKTIVAVAAAVVIPFAAPAIAGSIGLSSTIAGAVGSATAGSVIGGAIVGGTLNAATQALIGGDAKRGFLSGAVGGGLGGYFNAPTAPSAPTAPTAISSAGAPMSVPTQTVFDPMSGAFVQQAAPQMSYVPGMEPVSGATGMLAPQVAGLSAPSMVPTTESLAGMGVTPTQQAGLSVSPTTQEVQAATAPTAQAPTTQPKTFSEAIKQVPGQIASRFTDPKVLADLTLRAAGSIAGSALAGDGLSAQEKQLLDAQVQELQQLRQMNVGLFNQKLEQAMGLMGESKYFDPEYFGLQAARRAQLAGAQQKRAGLRGLTGERRAAEERRYDIATGRQTGTQYDIGYQTGVQGRLNTIQAGINAMPGYLQPTSGSADLRAAFESAEERRRKRAEDIGSLFGSFTGTERSRSTGNRPPGG